MKLIRLILLIPLLFAQLNLAKACQCPYTSLSMDECAKYQIIFRGKVQNVNTCENKKGEATFEILELYKGKIKNNFHVFFDCETECSQNLSPGEEWIIYTDYRQIDNAKLDWCSRTRKFFKNEKLDFYAVTYGNSYEDELSFLRDKLGTYKLLDDDNSLEEGPRNIKPNNNQIIIILLVSIGVIVLFYYIFNKVFK